MKVAIPAVLEDQQIEGYGIRRFELDDYLLQRSGAMLLQGAALTHLERSGGESILNNQFRSKMLVGAGGTFCPVARFLGAKVSREVVVAAQEAEFAWQAGPAQSLTP